MAAERDVQIPAGAVTLEATLMHPDPTAPLVAFAHGTGSSRFSPRNRSVARVLQEAGIGTLLMDLLTIDEEREERLTGHLRFDIPLLAERLGSAVAWAGDVPLGLFGASTGAAAALVTAAAVPERVRAVVSRGGRPDLAAEALPEVRAPTLLIVGGADGEVLELNRRALTAMRSAETRLEVVPGATHLFEEAGALERVSELAADWFRSHL